MKDQKRQVENLSSVFLDQAIALNKGRLARLMRAPVRLAQIRLLKLLGRTENVEIPLIFGSDKRFYGVLPEAVSSLVWRFNHFDPMTSHIVAARLPEDGVFIDIGAHFGYFSMLAAHCVGRNGHVYSFEAMPSTFEFLSNNIKRNEFTEICTLFNTAAFNENCTLKFTDFGVVNSSLNSAFGSRSVEVDAGESVDIKAVRLDDLAPQWKLNRVDLVKIDAESSEFFVIEGMLNTLKEFQPDVIVELGDVGVTGSQKTAREIIDLMTSIGYECWRYNSKGQLLRMPMQKTYDYCNVIFSKSQD